MQSPVPDVCLSSLDAPFSVERKRRARALDIMGPPSPEHTAYLPTPQTQRRKPSGAHAHSKPTRTTQLPTPQTLPRNRRSIIIEEDENMNDDDDADEGADLPSPSGRTTFVLAHAHGESSTISVRRRPGLLFAQHMGLLAGPSASGSSQPAKLGARLGAGIGMGGGLRQTHHDDNPFLDAPSTVGPSSSADRAVPPSPDRFTSYVPQALRLSAERSLSPHPRARPRKHARLPDRVARPALVDDPNNPFVARTGEVVRARPTSEDHPLVTYVFRGAKRVFANPFIHPSTSYPPAELDPSHEDYDPHPCPPPRLLWPSKEPSPPKTPPRAPPRRRRREEMEMEEEEESDEEDGMFARRGLLFSQADVPAKRPRLDGL